MKLAQVTLLAANGVVFFFCILYFRILLYNVSLERLNLFQVFLAVPKNVVFKLASKTVKLGEEDDDGSDDDDDWAHKVEQMTKQQQKKDDDKAAKEAAEGAQLGHSGALCGPTPVCRPGPPCMTSPTRARPVSSWPILPCPALLWR